MIEPNSSLIFNVNALAELIELENSGEKGLVGSLIADYQENSTNLLQQIRLAIVQKNKGEAEIRIHSLKSSSAVLGLEKLAGLCQRLENDVEKKFPTDDEMKQIEAEHAQGVRALQNFMRLSGST